MTVETPRAATGRRSSLRGRRSVAAVAVALAVSTGAGAADAAATYSGPAQAAGDDSVFAEDAAGPGIGQLPAIVLDAHRAGGLEARENSRSGIHHAITSGVVDVVDIDARQLADGTLGVMHDPTVDRVTTSTGPTSSYTSREWEALTLDIGSWLVRQPRPEPPPTLSAVLERFGERTVFTVEVKEGLVDEVARLLRALDLTNSVFVNTNKPDVARLIHDLGLRSHLWRTAAQMRTDEPRTFVDYVDLLDVDVRARKADFRRAVASGVPRVWAHTITTRTERRRALRWGANGVVTDDPRYVAGLTDRFPPTLTVVDLRRAPEPVQVSDLTAARVRASSESGPPLRRADVRLVSRQVVGRTVKRSSGGTSTLRVSATGAERGRTRVEFRVPAGSAGERRWPAGETSMVLRVKGEDLQLVPSVRVGVRRLRVSVRLLDSAATAYTGRRPEHGADASVADLRAAGLRLQVVRRGKVVHRDRATGADTGELGDGTGVVRFEPWTPPRAGGYTVRVAQRGPAYRHVVVESRVRMG
jgi:glycerophosphoryl diester phosphodiesterase